jgi:acyl-CoA thioesterase-1
MRMYWVAAFLLLAGCAGKPKEAPQPRAADPAQAAPAASGPKDDRPVIVAFGDSLSAGFGVDAGLSYPDFLQKLLDARGYRYHVVNAGISGDTSSDGLERVGQVIALHPEVVILEFGGNDGLRGLPVATTRSNMEEMIVALEKVGAKVVLAGMTLPPNYGPDYIQSFSKIYPELATKYKLPLVRFLLEGVGGDERYMQRDGLHANVEGNRRVAANVMQVLEKVIRKR